jgi:hypothetical protein
MPDEIITKRMNYFERIESHRNLRIRTINFPACQFLLPTVALISGERLCV